ncbi:hypothetical protein [Pygmaiobacter massiliensis]|uniref:hypothetical protein n=1 Tax=Pygmaiobacter massiliensis TaxID=1917873 RepID=UPI002A8209BF|nr:hypothetical protein [Pygmaiobacter massiliensis]MDY4785511.1 hypothetical protein [Pygmaiobacter massiliensis]
MKKQLPWPFYLFQFSLWWGMISSVISALSELSGAYIASAVIDVLLNGIILLLVYKRSKKFIIPLYCVSAYLVFVVLCSIFIGQVNIDLIALLAVNIIWIVYFKFSKSVKNAFYEPHENNETIDNALEVQQDASHNEKCDNCEDIINEISEKKNNKYQKHRFCKNCGTEYDAYEYKCHSCGKRVRLIPPFAYKKITVITISLMLAVSLSGNVALAINMNKLEDKNMRLKSDFESLQTDIQRTREANQNLSVLKSQYQDKSDFLTDKIAFVVSDDAECYHTYDCFIFQNAPEYWAYNTEAAISRGYRPCKLCH